MQKQNCLYHIDRRSFLRGIVGGVTVGPLASLAAQESGKSRVVLAERSQIMTNGLIDRKGVKEAVDALVKKLAGKQNVDEAWRTFVSPSETVALKFNGLFRYASTSPEVIWAVCRGLADAGVAQQKIIVFDRNQKDFDTAGLKPFADLPKVRFLSADSGWDKEFKTGSLKTPLTRILTKDADAIINLSRLKTHIRAGVTLSMKNHLGSVPNARDFHDDMDALAELSSLPPIRKKTRLSLCDAIVGIFDQGPRYAGPHTIWKPKSLLAATDVVALDAVGAEMIRKIRVTKGLASTRPSRHGRFGGIPEPTHITHAAEIGLGTADLNKIEIVKA